MLSKKLVLLLIFLLGTSTVEGNSNVGTSVFQFLKIGVGARPSGMGGAFVGVSDDESALFYNPSGLALIQKKSFLATYNNYVSDLQSGFVGYIYPLNMNKTIGFSISYFNFGSMPQTDSIGNVLGDFTPGSLALTVAYARRALSQLDLGGSFKLVYEKILNFSATGIALDLGGLYHFKDGRTRLGATLQNLGVQLDAFGDKKQELPASMKIGLSHHLKGAPLMVAVDVGKPRDNDFFLNVGGEFTHFKPVFLRAGWSSFGDNFQTSDEDNFWAGFGIGLGFNWRKYKFDYSFSSFADLGYSHRLTVAGGF